MQQKTPVTIHESAVRQFEQWGTPIEKTEEFLDMFVPDEGELNLIYGRIGQGKTTLTVTQMFDDLMRGQIVYSSFKVDWSGFDQRQSWVHLVVGLFFPWYRIYKRFPKENWHYLDCYADDIWDRLYKLNDCKIYFDDVIVKLFDSYEKTDFSKKKRQWAFETRHFDRSITLVTQRPNQVQIALRSQINRFYKCEKVMDWPILLFRRTEYQDMVQETVDETKPVTSYLVRPKKAVLNAFKTKYLRGGVPSSQKFYVDLFYMSYFDKVRAFFFLLGDRLSLKRKTVREQNSAKVIAQRSIISLVAGGQIENATLKNSNEGSRRVTVGGSTDEQEVLPF